MEKVPHNKTGHANIYKLDQESVITAYGKHDRVIAFLPMFEPEYGKTCLYCRVDTHHKLGVPSDQQVLTVARKDQGVKGRYRLIKRSEIYGQRGSIDFIFEKL